MPKRSEIRFSELVNFSGHSELLTLRITGLLPGDLSRIWDEALDVDGVAFGNGDAGFQEVVESPFNPLCQQDPGCRRAGLLTLGKFFLNDHPRISTLPSSHQTGK
jgi:hypothetical protein